MILARYVTNSPSRVCARDASSSDYPLQHLASVHCPAPPAEGLRSEEGPSGCGPSNELHNTFPAIDAAKQMDIECDELGPGVVRLYL